MGKQQESKLRGGGSTPVEAPPSRDTRGTQFQWTHLRRPTNTGFHLSPGRTFETFTFRHLRLAEKRQTDFG